MSSACQPKKDSVRPRLGSNPRIRCTVFTYCALASLSTLIAGCGNSNDAVVVKGQVTYLGNPLTKGQIRFVAEDENMTWMSGAYIVDGEYKVVNKGGVPVGKHSIEIVAYRPTAEYLQRNGSPGPDANWDVIPTEQFLPAKYNTQTELQMTIESGSSEIVKNFELAE